MVICAEKCLKSSNSLILEIKSWRELWEHLSLCCVSRHWYLPLCHIWQISGLIYSQKHPRKATGKTRTACCGGPENLLESSSVQRVIWVQGSLRQTRLNELLPNPKQSYNLLGFLLDLTQAQGSCKISVLHTRSASCLFCPETGKHLQKWKLKANKLKTTRADRNI